MLHLIFRFLFPIPNCNSQSRAFIINKHCMYILSSSYRRKLTGRFCFSITPGLTLAEGAAFDGAFLTWHFICRLQTHYCSKTLTNRCCMWDLNIHRCFIALFIFCLTPWDPLLLQWVRIILFAPATKRRRRSREAAEAPSDRPAQP